MASLRIILAAMAFFGTTGAPSSQEIVRDVARTDTEHFWRAGSTYATLATAMRQCGEDPSPYLTMMITDLAGTRFLNALALPTYAEAMAKTYFLEHEDDPPMPAAWGATEAFPHCSRFHMKIYQDTFDDDWANDLDSLLRLEAFLHDEATRPLLDFSDSNGQATEEPPVVSVNWKYFDAPVQIVERWRDHFDAGSITSGITIADAYDTYDFVCINIGAMNEVLPGYLSRRSDGYYEEIEGQAERYLADDRGTSWTTLQWAEACARSIMHR